MKVWLNETYTITKEENRDFGKGNNYFDYIEIYIPTTAIAKDNTMPSFLFELSNQKKYGPFIHDTPTVVDSDYTVFKLSLPDTVLSEEGKIIITISINYYNSDNKIYKNKNVTVQGTVLNHITVEGDIYILGNEKEIIESIKNKLDALNNRMPEKLSDLENDIQFKAESVVNPVIIKEDDKTLGKIEIINNEIKATTYNKEGNILKEGELAFKNEIPIVDEELNKESKNAIENSIVAIAIGNLKQALDILADSSGLSGLSKLIEDFNNLKEEWIKFIASEDGNTPNVIDTLNEIDLTLKKLSKITEDTSLSLLNYTTIAEHRKGLYNLGKFDVIEGNIITRKTGYITSDFVADNLVLTDWDETYKRVTLPLISNCTEISLTSDYYIISNEIYTKGNPFNADNPVYTLGIETNQLVIKMPDMTLEAAKEFIFKNPFVIQYQLNKSFNEKILPEQSINILDQRGIHWLQEEREKILNYFSGFVSGTYGNLTVTDNGDESYTLNGRGGVSIPIKKSIPMGTYSFFVTIVSGSVTGGSNSGLIFKNLWMGSNKQTETITTSKVNFWAHANAVFDNYRIKISVCKGNVNYGWYPYYGSIVHYKELVRGIEDEILKNLVIQKDENNLLKLKYGNNVLSEVPLETGVVVVSPENVTLNASYQYLPTDQLYPGKVETEFISIQNNTGIKISITSIVGTRLIGNKVVTISNGSAATYSETTNQTGNSSEYTITVNYTCNGVNYIKTKTIKPTIVN